MYKHREPKGRPFDMFHCWALLQNNEKWKDRNNECLGRKKAQEDGDDEEVQEVADMAAPKNVKKRPPGRRGEKDKEVDASIFKTAIEGIIETKKELVAVKTQEKESRWLEVKAMEELAQGGHSREEVDSPCGGGEYKEDGARTEDHVREHRRP